MNQIFPITVGSDTLQGRLPTYRIGQGYCARFFVYGVAHVADVPPPKIWITISESLTKFWSGVWNEQLGLWVIDVNSEATVSAKTMPYALTMFGESADKEYVAGQGWLTVYATAASVGGETGGTAGETVDSRLNDLELRVAAMEEKFGALSSISSFDPESAFDIDLRTQVTTITKILRGEA